MSIKGINEKTAGRTYVSAVKEEATRYGIEISELPGVLALILGDIPDDTMQHLLQQGLRDLMNMSEQELANFKGIGIKKAVRLKAAFELHRRIVRLMPEDNPSITNPGSAAAMVMHDMRFYDREHFMSLLLNVKNQVIAREIISIGTLDASSVHPREVFKTAVKRSAASIILVHNHPSGDPEPSTNDIEITKQLVEAGKIIGINILDHLVIGDNRYVSFKEKDLFK